VVLHGAGPGRVIVHQFAVHGSGEGGGQITRGPIELWADIWIAHCIDSQGAVFALQGKSTKTGQADDPQSAPQVGWSAEWGDISSRGRLLGIKPKGRSGR
jgi:hypothetical protein